MAQAAVDCTISASQGDALFYSMLQRGVALCPEIGLHGEHALTAAFAVIRTEFLISARALEISLARRSAGLASRLPPVALARAAEMEPAKSAGLAAKPRA